jgi:uncharacterized Zn finger protein (UPF0148 family)
MEKSNMTESEGKVLVCRQCGKEFCFTGAEQELYLEKGWLPPSHCPQCRSTRRKLSLRLACAGCGVELKKDDSVYCPVCMDSLKLEAELEHHRQQERTKELESRLESLGEMEQRLASVTMELEKTQQAIRESQGSKAVPHEAASWSCLEESLQHLNEQFGAFEQSYACDIDKLTGLLLEVQHALTQQREPCLWHRMRMAFSGKTRRHGTASSKANNLTAPSAPGYPENAAPSENKDAIET